MMGQRRDQGRLFYEFRLEDRIPENHLLRRMKRARYTTEAVGLGCVKTQTCCGAVE